MQAGCSAAKPAEQFSAFLDARPAKRLGDVYAVLAIDGVVNAGAIAGNNDREQEALKEIELRGWTACML